MQKSVLVSNKLLVYKEILNPIWTGDSEMNVNILGFLEQTASSNERSPCYIWNVDLYRDLKVSKSAKKLNISRKTRPRAA